VWCIPKDVRHSSPPFSFSLFFPFFSTYIPLSGAPPLPYLPFMPLRPPLLRSATSAPTTLRLSPPPHLHSCPYPPLSSSSTSAPTPYASPLLHASTSAPTPIHPSTPSNSAPMPLPSCSVPLLL
jgi:hypothetical protein